MTSLPRVYLVDLSQSWRHPFCDVQIPSSRNMRHVPANGTHAQNVKSPVFVGQSSLDTFLQFIINKVVLQLVICQGGGGQSLLSTVL